MLVHAWALLTSHPDGATSYIDADVRDPESILRAARGVLDFPQPIAVMMVGITAFFDGLTLVEPGVVPTPRW